MTITHSTVQTTIAAIAALLAAAAAYFAWDQVAATREHNRVSVRPILQLTPYLEGAGKRNGLYLSNDGLGPAIIKSFAVRSGGSVTSGFGVDRWPEIIRAGGANPACFATGWPKGETTIKTGAQEVVLALTTADLNGICTADLVKVMTENAVEIEVGYESMYGEAKTLRSDSRIVSKTLDQLSRLLTGRD